MPSQFKNQIIMWSVRTAVVMVAVVFGYWLAGGFAKTSDQWVHPLAQDAAWWEIVTALGVPAAIAIALFGDWRTHRRFESQMILQTKLDRRADKRQQAEWNRRDAENKSMAKARCDRIRIALQDEIIGGLIGIIEGIRHLESGKYVPQDIRVSHYNISSKISSSLGLYTVELDEMTLHTIALHDGAYTDTVDEIRAYKGHDTAHYIDLGLNYVFRATEYVRGLESDDEILKSKPTDYLLKKTNLKSLPDAVKKSINLLK